MNSKAHRGSSLISVMVMVTVILVLLAGLPSTQVPFLDPRSSTL